MEDSIYKSHEQSLKNFATPQEAIKYYEFMLNNNPESSVYPRELREYHKGIILGIKGAIELNNAKLNKMIEEGSKFGLAGSSYMAAIEEMQEWNL